MTPARQQRFARVAGAIVGTDETLLNATQARIGRHVHAATILQLGTRTIDALLPRRDSEQILLAITDEHVYLLECQRRTLAPQIGAVLEHLPRNGLVATWKRRRLNVKAELSWPEQHVFISATARPGAHTDHVIGLLMGSELERYE